jgi:hypothetical protein
MLFIARGGNALVQINFNGIELSAKKSMTAGEIVKDYHYKLQRGCADYRNSEAGMRVRTKQALDKRRVKRENEAALSYEATETFDIGNAEVYQRIKGKIISFYGEAVIQFAERWAKLMQKEIRAGEILTRDMAEDLSRKANVDNISGSEYTEAKWILMLCWAHGAKLRQAYGAN